ncbi:hypothetical protein GCM10027418_04880 [Mariniluteicoccus endophyticus]
MITASHGGDIPSAPLSTLTHALAVLSNNDVLLAAHTAAINITRQWGSHPTPEPGPL